MNRPQQPPRSTRADLVQQFKRELSRFHGYDENLKYVGRGMGQSPAVERKAFLEPRDFLDFAVEDAAALDKEKNLINCLGNCKRAIDAQVDRLIGRLGLWPLAKREGWNVPKKLDFISASGLVAPRVLRNVNALRNRMEHDHAVPSRQQVEDALDVATLFVSYAELVRIPTMNWNLSSGLCVRYDYDQMVFQFFEKEPFDLLEDEDLPAFLLKYGEDGFQDFYDFLMKTVPSMERRR